MAAPLSMASVMSVIRRCRFCSWLGVQPLSLFEKKREADGVRSSASFEMDVLFTKELLLEAVLAVPLALLQ
jgi:hypothetical protein